MMNDKIYEMNKEYLKIVSSTAYKVAQMLIFIKSNILNFKNIRLILFEVLQRIKTQKYSGKKCRYIEKKDIQITNKRIAIYTSIFGEYDKILNPMYINDNVDYFIFTDLKVNDNMIWHKFDISNLQSIIGKLSNQDKNRYFKMLGYQYLKNYDYIIYIDGNLEIYGNLTKLVKYINSLSGLAMYNHPSRDCIYNEAEVCKILKKGNYHSIDLEINRYKDEKMPRHYGMCECNVIVKDMHNAISDKILSTWWMNYINGTSKRDQISFPYTLWTMNIQIEKIGCLGENINIDPNFRRKLHTNS